VSVYTLLCSVCAHIIQSLKLTHTEYERELIACCGGQDARCNTYYKMCVPTHQQQHQHQQQQQQQAANTQASGDTANTQQTQQSQQANLQSQQPSHTQSTTNTLPTNPHPHAKGVAHTHANALLHAVTDLFQRLVLRFPVVCLLVGVDNLPRAVDELQFLSTLSVHKQTRIVCSYTYDHTQTHTQSHTQTYECANTPTAMWLHRLFTHALRVRVLVMPLLSAREAMIVLDECLLTRGRTLTHTQHDALQTDLDNYVSAHKHKQAQRGNIHSSSSSSSSVGTPQSSLYSASVITPLQVMFVCKHAETLRSFDYAHTQSHTQAQTQTPTPLSIIPKASLFDLFGQFFKSLELRFGMYFVRRACELLTLTSPPAMCVHTHTDTHTEDTHASLFGDWCGLTDTEMCDCLSLDEVAVAAVQARFGLSFTHQQQFYHAHKHTLTQRAQAQADTNAHASTQSNAQASTRTNTRDTHTDTDTDTDREEDYGFVPMSVWLRLRLALDDGGCLLELENGKLIWRHVSLCTYVHTVLLSQTHTQVETSHRHTQQVQETRSAHALLGEYFANTHKHQRTTATDTHTNMLGLKKKLVNSQPLAYSCKPTLFHPVSVSMSAHTYVNPPNHFMTVNTSRLMGAVPHLLAAHRHTQAMNELCNLQSVCAQLMCANRHPHRLLAQLGECLLWFQYQLEQTFVQTLTHTPTQSPSKHAFTQTNIQGASTQQQLQLLQADTHLLTQKIDRIEEYMSWLQQCMSECVDCPQSQMCVSIAATQAHTGFLRTDLNTLLSAPTQPYTPTPSHAQPHTQTHTQTHTQPAGQTPTPHLMGASSTRMYTSAKSEVFVQTLQSTVPTTPRSKLTNTQQQQQQQATEVDTPTTPYTSTNGHTMFFSPNKQSSKQANTQINTQTSTQSSLELVSVDKHVWTRLPVSMWDSECWMRPRCLGHRTSPEPLIASIHGT
jgi:hypothetical protein